MNNNQVIELLKNYRSYEYAARSCGNTDDDWMPVVIHERKRNPNTWDRARYNRIVNLIDGALKEVLSDDQRTVIMRKYLDRNKMSLHEIAAQLHRDRGTVSKWHKEAINQLCIALMPLTKDELEIEYFEHMFDERGVFRKPA